MLQWVLIVRSAKPVPISMLTFFTILLVIGWVPITTLHRDIEIMSPVIAVRM